MSEPETHNADGDTAQQSWIAVVHDLDEQTAKLVSSIELLDETAIRAPSRIPGWSRAHVIAHLIGNAQGMDRLARWARDGVERPAYVSRQARDADIQLLAERSYALLLDSIRESVASLSDSLSALDQESLDHMVSLVNGEQLKACDLVPHRLQEVCVHHSDLEIGNYSWRNWPTHMSERMARRVIADFSDRADFPVGRISIHHPDRDETVDFVLSAQQLHVTGSAQATLAWLLGRSDGEGLKTQPHQVIPSAPHWR